MIFKEHFCKFFTLNLLCLVHILRGMLFKSAGMTTWIDSMLSLGGSFHPREQKEVDRGHVVSSCGVLLLGMF